MAATQTMVRVQDRITQYWHNHAANYDAHPQSRLHEGVARSVWQQVWAQALAPLGDDRTLKVLDVGTGTGQVARMVAGLGHDVHGTDLAAAMVDIAKQRAAKELGEGLIASAPDFAIGDAVTPAFPAQSFDAITLRYLLWTLREPQVALENWRALLRPGGRLAVVDAPWHSQGLRDKPAQRDDGSFLSLYNDQVVDALPLSEATSIDATAALVTQAGFDNVEVAALTQIQQAERAGLEDPDAHGVQLQYLIMASAPGPS